MNYLQAGLRWLRSLWWAQQRQIDILTLWPACKAQASSLEQARAAFAQHAFTDPAWVCHYERRLWDAISELT